MKTNSKICNFECWCEEGPDNNFLLHSKSTRIDGSFDHLCQSFDSMEEAYFVGQALTNKMRDTLTKDGLTILGDHHYKNFPVDEKESKNG